MGNPKQFLFSYNKYCSSYKTKGVIYSLPTRNYRNPFPNCHCSTRYLMAGAAACACYDKGGSRAVKAFEGLCWPCSAGSFWSQWRSQRKELQLAFVPGTGYHNSVGRDMAGGHQEWPLRKYCRGARSKATHWLLETKTTIVHLVCLSKENNMFRCGF